MIPIASILISKGVAPGVMIALILGGAGASIPEVQPGPRTFTLFKVPVPSLLSAS